ncbi:MAG: DUF6212 domain-containing protein [Azospirillaceae bacterium]|nr:DUF6212 domain-containing protein [Azospirillaceae bacterium]
MPTDIVAAVSFSDEGAAIVVAAAAEWQARGWPALRTHRVAAPPGGEAAAFARHVQEILFARYRDMATMATRLMRELAEVRALHEGMQENFLAVEEYLSRQNPPRLSLLHSSAPSGYVTQLSAESPTVRQRLPLPSRSVIAIDVHLDSVPGGDGTLTVALFDQPEGNLLEQWSVAGSDLEPGWLTFSLPRALSGMRTDLDLVCTWQGDEYGPALSLGMLCPLPDLCASGPKDEELRPLSLQIWGGLMGVGSIPDLGPVRLLSEQSRDGLVRYVPRRTLLAAQSLWVIPDSIDFTIVGAVDGELRVHPLEGMLVGAVLQKACPAGAVRIGVTVLTDNPMASIVDYAVYVGASSAQADLAFKGTAPSRGLSGFSGWVRVPPAVPATLHVELLPNAEEQHIFIATRLTNGSSSSYGWANVKSIEVTRTARG